MAQTAVENGTSLTIHAPEEDHSCVNGMDLSNGEVTPGGEPAGDGHLSPSPRRSTRASALKAQEKLKIKDGEIIPKVEEEGLSESESGKEEVKAEGEREAKRRRLESGKAMNQFSHEFAIKIENNDEVYMMSEGSEISSLHDSEVELLKKCYDKVLSKEMTEEQKRERLLLIKQAELDLRSEEAKLAVLKKMRQSQQQPNKAMELNRKVAATQNATMAAYKPPVANPKITAPLTNGKSSTSTATASKTNPLLNLTPAQQEMLMRSLNPLNASALPALLAAAKSQGGGGNNQAAALAAVIAQAQAAQQAQAAALSANSQQQQMQLQMKQLAAQTPAQRAATARQAFRRQADQQLMQISAPKAPPTDMFFIPNGNQPDFCYLLGLDLAVARVQKDRSIHRPVTEGPYVCEECATDFTPSWRAIAGADENDVHLYCETCVRVAQKKKIRSDRNTQLKKAYTKIIQQEKEFEKQIQDGKLDAALAAAAAAVGASAGSTTSTSSGSVGISAASLAASASSQQAQNLSTKTSTPTPTPVVPKATPTPAASSSTTSTPKHTSTPSSTKKSSSSNNAATMQAQLQALQQMARQNPMFAAMMPLLQTQMGNSLFNMGNMSNMSNMQAAWSPLLLQQMQQMQQLQQRMGQNQTNVAMNLLAHAVQNAQTGNSAATSSSSMNNANTAFAQIAAAAAVNPALLSNPTLMRQMQQHMQSLKNQQKK